MAVDKYYQLVVKVNDQIGYAEWANLQNPDVYCVRLEDGGVAVANFHPDLAVI